MSTYHTIGEGSQATLASLITLVLADEGQTETARREMASAIRTVAKVLKAEPHMILATQSHLRPLLNEALPAAAGVGFTRWRNATSLLRKAIGMIDPAVIPARSKATLLPAWATLLQEPAVEPFRRGLARISKYCSAKGLGPFEVTQAVYDGFYDDLQAHCIIRSPRETQQAAGHAWNDAQTVVPGWPQVQLKIEDFRTNRSLPWEAFPASFHEDVHDHLTPQSIDIFDLSRDEVNLRPATIKSKELQYRQIASALVESGWAPSTIKTLADIVTVDAAKASLAVFLGRSNQVKTGRIYGLAYLMVTTARHWTRSDPAALKDLEALARRMNPKKTGMTSKNRSRLRQFRDERLLGNLLLLPTKMMAQACKAAEPSAADARSAQLAVAIEILTTAPIRVLNLSELEIGRTLILSGGKVGHIVIDHTEVKNEVDLEIPLPSATLQMIATYLKRFHPLLAPPGCKMLFPSRDSGHKRSTVLSHQITTLIRRSCGVEMNVHLFRHFAAMLYLDVHPGEYGVIRMLLGHKSIQTTIDTYCGMEFAAAFKAYDELVTQLKSERLKIVERKQQRGRR